MLIWTSAPFGWFTFWRTYLVFEELRKSCFLCSLFLIKYSLTWSETSGDVRWSSGKFSSLITLAAPQQQFWCECWTAWAGSAPNGFNRSPYWDNRASPKGIWNTWSAPFLQTWAGLWQPPMELARSFLAELAGENVESAKGALGGGGREGKGAISQFCLSTFLCKLMGREGFTMVASFSLTYFGHCVAGVVFLLLEKSFWASK